MYGREYHMVKQYKACSGKMRRNFHRRTSRPGRGRFLCCFPYELVWDVKSRSIFAGSIQRIHSTAAIIQIDPSAVHPSFHGALRTWGWYLT